MKPLKHTFRRIIYSFSLLSLDLLLLSGALFFAFWLRYKVEWPWLTKLTYLHFPSYWFAFSLALYLVIAQLAARNLYALERLRTWQEEQNAIFKSVSITTLLLLSISFFYRNIEYSRQMVLFAWPLAIMVLGAGRGLFRGILFLLKANGKFERSVLILGRGGMLPVIFEKIVEHKGLGLKIEGIIAEQEPSEAEFFNIPYFGSWEELEKTLKEKEIDIILLIQEQLNQDKVLEAIEICEKLHVELLLIPQVFDLLISFSDLHDLHGLPMVELREEQIGWSKIIFKRIFDFYFAIIIFIFTLPLQLVLALLIRLDSKGSVIFSQTRVGYRGKRFQMLKFRSMVSDADKKLKNLLNVNEMKEPVFKLEKDPRVTRIGRWLRKTSLDELPQLWNVIIGQMSLVGPRPEETAMVKKYNVWQRRRLKVKPGITGLQQIKCRGSNSLAERVKFDIYYIRRMSFLLDLEILLKTIWVVLSQKGAH